MVRASWSWACISTCCASTVAAVRRASLSSWSAEARAAAASCSSAAASASAVCAQRRGVGGLPLDDGDLGQDVGPPAAGGVEERGPLEHLRRVGGGEQRLQARRGGAGHVAAPGEGGDVRARGSQVHLRLLGRGPGVVRGGLHAPVARQRSLVPAPGGRGLGVGSLHRRPGGAQLGQGLTDLRSGVIGGLLSGVDLRGGGRRGRGRAGEPGEDDGRGEAATTVDSSTLGCASFPSTSTRTNHLPRRLLVRSRGSTFSPAALCLHDWDRLNRRTS